VKPGPKPALKKKALPIPRPGFGGFKRRTNFPFENGNKILFFFLPIKRKKAE